MTSATTAAFEAMLAHHADLVENVQWRVATLRAAIADGASYEQAAAELVAYLAHHVLPFAVAEEHTVYRVAATKKDMAVEVAAMVDQHRHLASSVERLATAVDGVAASAEATTIENLITAHVTTENEVILPLLAADADVNLPGLLIQMHRLTETAQNESSTIADITSADN